MTRLNVPCDMYRNEMTAGLRLDWLIIVVMGSLTTNVNEKLSNPELFLGINYKVNYNKFSFFNRNRHKLE